MSLVNLANVCSHLQNASKARLGLTSIPVSKLHVALMLALQREGFLSSVTLGGANPPANLVQGNPSPPADELVAAQKEPEPSADALAAEPWLIYDSRDWTDMVRWGDDAEQVVPRNLARRRLWLGLKYWDNEPVLSRMGLISKPKKRVILNSAHLQKITRGFEANFVKGLRRPGECIFLNTDRGVLESRICAEKNIGGMALCRVL
ncbi:ribosomal protein S8 [Lineolata rhizophorae]|uniref:Ribosomal protein S8 n=1 Tax=Lineolata rhizophorae TaxID=578093 RepID=A0A6A6P676_9PEZI|nr:ribosomal protein S8 [Lineolata rhizophorae]